jgi:hypothetical protein
MNRPTNTPAGGGIRVSLIRFKNKLLVGVAIYETASYSPIWVLGVKTKYI